MICYILSGVTAISFAACPVPWFRNKSQLHPRLCHHRDHTENQPLPRPDLGSLESGPQHLSARTPAYNLRAEGRGQSSLTQMCGVGLCRAPRTHTLLFCLQGEKGEAGEKGEPGAEVGPACSSFVP